MRIKIKQFLSVSEVEYVAHRLAREHMMSDKPIPNSGTRFPSVLERCLGSFNQTFGGKELYPSLADKAAMLFYVMIKNHPFQNGNKRIAVATLLYFLYKNNRWMDLENSSLYKVAKLVAESSPEVREGVMVSLRSVLKKHSKVLSK